MLARVTDPLSLAQARRMTLAAQGFARPRPKTVTARHLHAVMRDIGVLQIDSVNVFSRSHYMPMFSRLGAYDTARLDKLVFSGTPYVEYWAHAAAFMPAHDWPLWQFRMDKMRRKYGEDPARWAAQNPETIEWVRRELAERGPLRPAEIEDDARSSNRGPWWDWDRVKHALEHLFLIGEVAIAGRRGFERRYALAEHVIPAGTMQQTWTEAAAIRELMGRALASYGVATAADLADYYRVSQKQATAAIRELEDEGIAIATTVQGWQRGGKPIPAWVHRDAKIPRTIDACAILTPFDPLVWFRDRAARMYDFDYRIEIYTPQQRRVFGYYSLPVLAGDTIIGRIDLKADRARSTLLVQSAWWEHESHAEHADAIAEQIRLAALWRGLERISVSSWGNATSALAGALHEASRHERES